ncbi:MULTISPECIES: catecholate siderophore receptor Fiu [Tatumella]|uniref:Catecholate siderophore receptor Fiu n=1 Tax=Tatumella punctata TaxID=399969 RepID=A0ABW1VL27_9GAMM|nr:MULTISPECIES: catecholate siderophore receptor Fiu [unclassified Tatumella]MBS0855395.1 catecholate siderophore receptor Fiu [Tatumella sp. JGM16]MBS0894056.1 catecholate siderophore receptor Fiu [Tatumella sp. JGM130]MBS0911629.1 catecholate siderophore receptor Fiu [Tatumella sp. JGM91]
MIITIISCNCGSSVNSKKNISPAFKTLGTLSVFAGLCAASGVAQAQVTPAATDSAAAAKTAPAAGSKKAAGDNTLVVTGSSLPSLYLPSGLSDPKFTAPLADTTRTVTIIPEKVLQEQQATTLTEALKNSPGVGAFFSGENGSTNMGDAIMMRGIDTSGSIYSDGIRDIGSITRDTFNTQSIEVIKGPSGSDYGRTAPSGSINMVSKQPELYTGVDGSLGYGSASERRATLDYNQMLSDTAAFRVNVMGDKGNTKDRDHINHQKFGIAPSLAFGLGTKTRWYLDYFHEQQDNTPDGGVYTVGLPGYSSTNSILNNSGPVSRSTFYGTDSDYEHDMIDTFTSRLEHDFNDRTTLRNTTRWSEIRQRYLLSAVLGRTITETDGNVYGSRLMNSSNTVNKILTNQTNLTTKFDTFGMQHNISTGLELTREDYVSYPYAFAANSVNLLNPDADTAVSSATGYGSKARTNTLGVYAFDTLKLTQRIEFNGGLRLDSYKTHYTGDSATGHTDLSHSGNLVNWKAGALYHLTKEGNLYVNYGVSQQPPGGTDFKLTSDSTDRTSRSGENINFKPERAETSELGTKWSLLNKKLLLSAALFRTTIKNDAELDTTTNQYQQIGSKRVQGYELTAAGDITDNIHLMAGYTLQNTRTDKTSATNDGSSYIPFTPRHAFTSWATWDVTDDVTVGLGARYTGSMHKIKDGASGTPSSVDHYWVADSMATWRVNPTLDLQLNVYNMFNKKYIAALNRSGYRYTPGTPRTWMLTANVHF